MSYKGLEQHLLPRSSPSDETSDEMTALNFLKSPETAFDTYYSGEIYKEQTFNPVTGAKSLAKSVAGFQQFISYKFKHPIGSETYTFIITFRKKHITFYRKSTNKYHIRLSILPENGLKCERKHLSIKLTYNGGLEYPNESDKEHNFTSIYKGQWTGDARVRNMKEMRGTQIDSYDFASVVETVKKNIDTLGQILVNACNEYTKYNESNGDQAGDQAGGYTRKYKRLTRKCKSVLKRKCKKSYRKKKYGKSKKSRKLRRSVKSRR
jgi:hypothetical protein